MAQKIRLDLHLLTKGLVESRQQAQQLIRAGKVRDVTGKILDKPGQEVFEESKLLVENPKRFVSRGGEKLLAALKAFPIKIDGRVCLDCGISTGGFTDCLLQHGATRVYGVDVGYGQTAWSLRNDSRVVLRERTNLRNLKPEQLYGPKDQLPTLAVADLSFISLRLVLPAIKNLLSDTGQEALLLVKPQFEIGRNRVGKGGVVKDINAHIEVLKNIIAFSCAQLWIPKGILASPITGPAGNHEYLLWLSSFGNKELLNIEKLVKETLV